ncbi:MAG: uroporphyrin-III C-methyltransferase [Kangiellaceae bacterium]|jgi:uroporphyrin-III C-methyltransferase
MSKLINIATRASHQQKGFVWIVGAGPGDAELLTIKAYKALQVADVVLFDWLVDEAVLQLIPKSTNTEFVGKRSGRHSMEQGDICQRIVFHALQGKNVVRLKGGDPAIFARTVEETYVLTQHEIDYAIVPGITSASGACAYSGIPLTHRDYAQSVTFTTASLQCKQSEPNWQSLVKTSAHQTLVFYMGLGKIKLIAQRLLENGISPSYPVAVIDKACTTQQSIIKGTLYSISQMVSDANISGPAIIVCGEVVNHQQKVSLWAQNQSPEAVVKRQIQERLSNVQLAI